MPFFIIPLSLMTNESRSQDLCREKSCWFHQFFRLGCKANEQNMTSSFKSLSSTSSKFNKQVQNIVQLLIEHNDWLFHFVSDYPLEHLQIDEPKIINNLQFQMRSGLQFIVDLFNGIDDKLDKILSSYELEIYPESSHVVALNNCKLKQF